MQTLPVWSYYSAQGQQIFASSSDVDFSGTWSGTTVYMANQDVVVWGTGTDQYVAIYNNLNQPPGSGQWSSFVNVSDTLPPPPYPLPAVTGIVTIGTGIPGPQGPPGPPGPSGANYSGNYNGQSPLVGGGIPAPTSGMVWAEDTSNGALWIGSGGAWTFSGIQN